MVKNYGRKKYVYVKTIFLGVIIITLFQIRRLFALHILFMLFTTILGISYLQQIRNIAFFIYRLRFFRVQSPNNLKYIKKQFLPFKTDSIDKFK